MRGVLAMAADGFEVIGGATPPSGQGVVSRDLKNVPDVMPWGFIYTSLQPTLPATWWLDR